MSTRRRLARVAMVSLVLTAAGVASVLSVLLGIVPYSTNRVVLEPPILPYDFTYMYSILSCTGHGNYFVRVEADVPMNVTIIELRKTVSLRPGEVAEFVVERSRCVNVLVVAVHRAYDKRSGVVVISRRSI